MGEFKRKKADTGARAFLKKSGKGFRKSSGEKDHIQRILGSDLRNFIRTPISGNFC